MPTPGTSIPDVPAERQAIYKIRRLGPNGHGDTCSKITPEATAGHSTSTGLFCVTSAIGPADGKRGQIAESFENSPGKLQDGGSGCILRWNPPKGAAQVAQIEKNPPAIAGDVRDLSLIPGTGRSPGGGHGNPLQHSCLESPVDGGAWWAAIHRVAESHTTELTGRQRGKALCSMGPRGIFICLSSQIPKWKP